MHTTAPPLAVTAEALARIRAAILTRAGYDAETGEVGTPADWLNSAIDDLDDDRGDLSPAFVAEAVAEITRLVPFIENTLPREDHLVAALTRLDRLDLILVNGPGALRRLLIDPSEAATGAEVIMVSLIESLDIESHTRLLLDHSLCPLHSIDYAICFDEDEPECAAIRKVHPQHDS